MLQDALHQCVRCPQLKREWVGYAVGQMKAELRDSVCENVDLVQRFTGRLTHLSQYFPEFKHPLAVGYSLSRSKWARRLWRDTSGRRLLRLGERSRSRAELLELLEVALDVATDNVGAGPLLRCTRRSTGTLTVVTDASRADADDGFGGYAFVPGAEGIAFLLSSAWPEFAKAAIDAAASERAVR